MNGLLILDKPSGVTSHDVVAIVRRATGEKSIGHLGTLDPMATGVLPLLLGKYTRLALFFSSAEKHYEGHIRFGHATDTYDAEGDPTTDPKPLTLSLEDLQHLATHFQGTMDQLPPIYSAKKINGVPAHKLARAGLEAPVKPARVTIHHFALTALEGDCAKFEMSISAGGYVRSVAHDLGQILGCGAHLARLRRVAAGPFTLAQALTLEELGAQAAAGTLEQSLPHPRTLLPELPATTADLWVAGRLRNGNAVNLPEYSTAPLAKVFAGQRDLVAIVRRVAGTLFQPVVVLG